MHAFETPSKPLLAMVIAFCDSTPHDPQPRPHVVAQPAAETGKHELWNTPFEPDMSRLNVFQAFADAYLLNPTESRRVAFMPLAHFEAEHWHLHVFATSRILRWHDFQRLDDKELIPFTSVRKQPIWTELTQQAVEHAYRSEGMKLILDHAKFVRRNQWGAQQAYA